jgi:hypothetical protein
VVPADMGSECWKETTRRYFPAAIIGCKVEVEGRRDGVSHAWHGGWALIVLYERPPPG